MNRDQTERLVVAFEKIATELGRANDTAIKAFEKQWPERKEFREAIVTRVPTEEDIIKENQGASDEPISEWIGFREKQYIEEKKAASSPAPVPETGESGGGRAEEAGSDAGTVGVSAANNTTV